MKAKIRYFLLGLMVVVLPCCKDKDDTSTIPDTPPIPSTGSENVLYNGIELPAQWPPRRNYASDLRRGMSPYYLSKKPAVINISVGRQLFVDNFLIASTTLQRQYHYPEYYAGNPVISPEKEWELGGANGDYTAPFSDGLWYDETESKFKMWYMSGGGPYTTGEENLTCYAESEDGITWTKPVLNIVSGTNIVRTGIQRDASTIWLDKQEANSSARYKMFEVARGKDNKMHYNYLTSADGKLWRDNVAPSKVIGDRSTVYKNPFRNKWIWSIRHNIRLKSDEPVVRARDYFEYADPKEGNKLAEADVASFWFATWPNEQIHPDYHNNDGSPGVYNHDAIAYESIILGLFSMWQGPENDVCNRDHIIKRNQIMLGYSRDGYSWYREDMNPFLAVDATNTEAWNNGNLQSVVGTPLIVGDKLYFYLSGRKLKPNGKEIVTTGLATLRRDGFVSMSGRGELTTEVLAFTGKYFFVNADIRGSLKVELLDTQGNVIPGFSRDDCDTLTQGGTRQQITWRGNKEFPTGSIKVKFYVEDCDLYAFWISPNLTGESGGYTGGGGPNLNPSGIDVQ